MDIWSRRRGGIVPAPSVYPTTMTIWKDCYIMSKSIQKVKVVSTKVDEINALAQYIRSDLSKATAAMRRRDIDTFIECADNLISYIHSWRDECVIYIDDEDRCESI